VAASGLPKYLRYKDLEAQGIVGSWTQLLRLIDDNGFPQGILLSPNIRAWTEAEVCAWLAARPTKRKVMPEGARPPFVQKRRRGAR
jgi:predicted DNA-binding transcriptional regulator AlpA